MRLHSRQILKTTLLGACLLLSLPIAADTIRVAVASNFTHAMRDLAQQFQAETGHRVHLAFGSTGKHYAQIHNGAPFDAFFAADRKRPQRLEQDGAIVPGSRFTYASGRLALWSPDSSLVDAEASVLANGDYQRLAIANPKLAPYGKAAQQVLEQRGLWRSLRPKLVRGENIGQTFQFVQSGSAQLGFVALSQIQQPGSEREGSRWIVPASLHQPIDQQAVLLKDGTAAREFLDFVRGQTARDIIKAYGYSLPR